MSYQYRKVLGLAAAMLVSASSLFAQSADEIVKKHNDAVGGAAAWKKVNTIRMTGKQSAMGMELPTVVSKQRNTGTREDFEVMGTKCYILYTPGKAWAFVPPQGMNTPTELPAEAVKMMETKSFLGDLVMEMGDHGYKFESAGISTLDGKPVVPGKGTPESDQYFRLKAMDAAGNATDLYFDMKTYHLVKTSRMINAEGQEVELAYTYSDYQKQAEGVYIPTTVSSDQGEMKLTKIEINPTLEASLFKP